MSEIKKIVHPIENPFLGRTDGYVDTPKICNGNIQETWVHKQVIVPTCENPGEDDFILTEKPVKIGEIDLDKQIQEQAKGTDLKSLVAMVIRTGDESFLNSNPGQYFDATGFDTDPIAAHNNIVKSKDTAGTEFNSIGSMTKEEVDKYINDIVQSRLASLTPAPEVAPVVDDKGESK